MTNTSASAVHRSLIARGSVRSESRRSSPRAGCRSRRPGLGRPVKVFEEAEEPGVRGEHKGSGMAVERVPIGLHRAVEGEEILVLPKGVGVGLDAFGIAFAAHPLGGPLGLGKDNVALAVGVGANGLRRLGALGAILGGLLLALRPHAGIDRLAVLFGQVGATNADIDDLNAEPFSLVAHLV